MSIVKYELAKKLLEIKAIKLSPEVPFTYASGLRGPIYCDNRLLLSHVELRNFVIEEFIRKIINEKLVFDLIGGIATAGIPYASIIADRQNLPMIYIRSKRKEYGQNNQIEGDYKKFQKVLLFEDLVNQGSSLKAVMKALLAAELNAFDCFCVVDYQMKKAREEVFEFNLHVHSLTDFFSIVEQALEMKMITETEKKWLYEWHEDPASWSMQF